MKKWILILVVFSLVSCTGNNKNNEDNNKNTSGEERPHIEDQNNDQEVDDSTGDGDDSKEDEDLIDDEEPVDSQDESVEEFLHYRVIVESLEIREEASLDSDLVGRASKGDIIIIEETFTDENGDLWLSPGEGWIPAWLCREIKVTDQVTDASYPVIVAKEDIDLHQRVGDDQTMGVKIAKDTSLRILDTYIDDDRQTWYKVITPSGYLAWIKSDHSQEVLRSGLVKQETLKVIQDLISSSSDLSLKAFQKAVTDRVDGSLVKRQIESNERAVFTIVHNENMYVMGHNKLEGTYEVLMDTRDINPLMIVNDLYLVYRVYHQGNFAYFAYDLVNHEQAIIAIDHIRQISQMDKHSPADLGDTAYILVDHLQDDLGTISYYDLKTGIQSPYKRPNATYEWQLEDSQYATQVNRVNRDTGESSLFHYISMDNGVFNFVEDESYLSIHEIDQALSLDYDDFTSERIHDYMMGLEKHIHKSRVEKIEYGGIRYAYYKVDLKEDSITNYVRVSYLVKWTIGTKKYQVIPRVEFDIYMQDLDFPMTPAEVETFLVERFLYCKDQIKIEYAKDGYYLLRENTVRSDVALGKLYWLDTERETKGMFDHHISQVEKIIDDRYIFVNQNDFFDTSLIVYDIEDGGSTVFYRRYRTYHLLKETDWLLVVIPHEVSVKNEDHAFGMGLMAVNYKTGQMKMLYQADKDRSYGFEVSEGEDLIDIYTYERGLDPEGVDKEVERSVYIGETEAMTLFIDEINLIDDIDKDTVGH